MNIYKPKENVIYKFVEHEFERIEPSPSNPFNLQTAWSGSIVSETAERNHAYEGLFSLDVAPGFEVEQSFAMCGYVNNRYNTSGDNWVIDFNIWRVFPGGTEVYNTSWTQSFIENTYVVDTVQYEWPAGTEYSTTPVTGEYGAQIGQYDDCVYTFEVDVNFPIFDSLEHVINFILTGSDEGLLNGTAEYEVEETKTYHITMNAANGELLYGNVKPVSGATYTQKSMRILANKTPILYFTGDGFQLRLTAGGVVASKAVSGPDYIIDNIPESQWTEGALDYTGYWYGNVDKYADAKGTLPEAGTYLYGFEFKTDCYIFPDRESAEEAEETGIYDKAINAYDVETGYYQIPIVGVEEAATTFGSGGVTSPFVSTYVCDRNDVLNVANAFYSNDTSIIDNIKKGLELFGAEPFQALCGLKWFPCSLANVVITASQNYVYFGSYKYESAGLSLDKVVSITANGYIDAGTVTLTPVQQSFRSFEPYCGLSVFLPYIGWQKLRIADYWGKTVNVRYYLDIYTGSCIAALVANNVFVDYFTGTLGVELPVTGQMLSQYSNSALNGLLGTAGGALGGAASGAMLAGTAGLALGPAGTAALAVGGAAAGAAVGLFSMSQKGAPKDHNTTKGSFTSSVGAYLPQYVIFRFDVHDLIIPDLLTDLYGRPSSASGKVSGFSGFLQADTLKLNTSGMEDDEANEVAAMLKEGVFV
jgi:hypothetical protein